MGHTKVYKFIYNGLDFFIIFSQSTMTQWLKFDIRAVFELVNMTNGSDHEVGTHFNK